MNQGDLFGQTTRRQEIDRQFRKFHEENPEVWNLFRKFTHLLISRGFKNHSADAVVHRIRWHTTVETTGSEYKIGNNFVTCYARLFHKTYPEHGDFFRTRERISEHKIAKEVQI